MGPADGLVHGELNRRQTLQQVGVERETVRGAASDLQPADLRADALQPVDDLVGGGGIVSNLSEPGPNRGETPADRLHALAAAWDTAQPFEFVQRRFACIESSERGFESGHRWTGYPNGTRSPGCLLPNRCRCVMLSRPAGETLKVRKGRPCVE